MDYYNQIKEELINNEAYKAVKDYSKNESDLKTYYNVGKLLSEAGKHYGEGIIKKYAIKLVQEVKKKYNERTLRRIRQFYNTFCDEKWSELPTKLTWSHYCELLKLKDYNEINYYIDISIRQNLPHKKLREKIRNKEYQRLPDDYKIKLVNGDNIKIEDNIKNPIIIKNNLNYDKFSEKVLQNLILEDLPEFMEELGEGYSFIKNEYKIKIGDRYNYIDLLLFNYIYNAFIVVELKVTELKKEHIGQLEVYMNYVDKNIKSINHNKTIGILLVKKENKFVIEYASDKRIYERRYVLK